MQHQLENIKAFLDRLTTGQKAGLGAVVFGVFGLLVAVGLWANQTEYSLLFGKLEPTEASSVVEALRSQNVAFELRDGGSAVYVPTDQVYELRLQFAGDGLVSDGVVGYELFDLGTLGMTDFMQKLNRQRAMEGELARTISSIKQVELARVHLVIPERSPFRETQNDPTASVVLQMAGSQRLATEQIEGITALVSGAVEGLSPSAVTVLDTRGNMLSDPNAGNADIIAGSNQLKMQQATEVHLTEKGQTMLDQVLGPGNAIVRVAATLDFTESVEESDMIDPESATVIAEERLEEQQGQGGATGAANSQVRNYEISRTRRRAEKNVGEIDYLTVSVVVNPKRETQVDEEGLETVVPRAYSEQELADIEALVQNAVGFNPERGDRITLTQTQFDTTVDEQIAEDMRVQRRNEQIQLFLRYGLMLAALAAAFFLIRSAARRVSEVATSEETGLMIAGEGPMTGQLVGADGQPVQIGETLDAVADDDDSEELVLVDDIYTSKLSKEAKARLKAKHQMFEEIKDSVMANPESAAELIRSWMMADNLREDD